MSKKLSGEGLKKEGEGNGRLASIPEKTEDEINEYLPKHAAGILIKAKIDPKKVTEEEGGRVATLAKAAELMHNPKQAATGYEAVKVIISGAESDEEKLKAVNQLKEEGKEGQDFGLSSFFSFIIASLGLVEEKERKAGLAQAIEKFDFLEDQDLSQEGRIAKVLMAQKDICGPENKEDQKSQETGASKSAGSGLSQAAKEAIRKQVKDDRTKFLEEGSSSISGKEMGIAAGKGAVCIALMVVIPGPGFILALGFLAATNGMGRDSKKTDKLKAELEEAKMQGDPSRAAFKGGENQQVVGVPLQQGNTTLDLGNAGKNRNSINGTNAGSSNHATEVVHNLAAQQKAELLIAESALVDTGRALKRVDGRVAAADSPTILTLEGSDKAGPDDLKSKETLGGGLKGSGYIEVKEAAAAAAAQPIYEIADNIYERVDGIGAGNVNKAESLYALGAANKIGEGNSIEGANPLYDNLPGVVDSNPTYANRESMKATTLGLKEDEPEYPHSDMQRNVDSFVSKDEYDVVQSFPTISEERNANNSAQGVNSESNRSDKHYYEYTSALPLKGVDVDASKEAEMYQLATIYDNMNKDGKMMGDPYQEASSVVNNLRGDVSSETGLNNLPKNTESENNGR